MLSKMLVALFAFSFAVTAQAQTPVVDESATQEIEELDPFRPDIEEVLKEFDEVYEQETGLSPFLEDTFSIQGRGCVRKSCAVWIQVVKSEQRLYLWVDGYHRDTWAVSTGVPGHGTPNFDKHPDGRIYDRYSSKKWPGGDYQGLGNMPYAVFISGGFALHGTPKGNWPYLGRRASHGCIRMHPDNGYRVNRLVRSVGIRNVWITVQD